MCLCMRSKCIERVMILRAGSAPGVVFRSSMNWSMWGFKCLIFTSEESSTGVQSGTFIMPTDVLSSVEKKSIKARGLYLYVFSPPCSGPR